MAKVLHVTLMLEVGDDTPEPDDWDWMGIVAQVPNVHGFSLIDAYQRPYPTMEEDPSNHTCH